MLTILRLWWFAKGLVVCLIDGAIHMYYVKTQVVGAKHLILVPALVLCTHGCINGIHGILFWTYLSTFKKVCLYILLLKLPFLFFLVLNFSLVVVLLKEGGKVGGHSLDQMQMAMWTIR